MNHQAASMIPYTLRFAAIYTLALCVAAVLLSLIENGGSVTMSLAALASAAILTGARFVRDHRRVPDARERGRLTWSSLLASVVVSSILVVGSLLASGETGLVVQLATGVLYLGTGTVMLVVALVLGVHFVVLWFTYGWSASLLYRSMEKRGEV